MNDNSAFEQLIAKAGTLTKKLGDGVMRRCLILGYTALAPGTPLRVSVIIFGAITYLLVPIDAIPDFIPAVGYSDDLTALASCFAAASGYITDDIREAAEAKMNRILAQLRRWF